jgi:Acetyltransferases
MNQNVVIREATLSDLPEVRRICLATCTDSYLLSHPKVLYLLYADYYLIEETTHCYVTIQEGHLVGYILSSLSRKDFAKKMKARYLPLLKKSDPHFYHLRKAYLVAMHFWPSYPAHLHIDIDPAYQHQGIGTLLMQTLLVNLRLQHVKGVSLSVSKTHPHAIAFYRQNRFQILYRWPGSYVLGRKL